MRIVQLVNNLDEIGGAERLVVDLAAELKKRGHDLHIVCLRTTGGPLADALARKGIPVTALLKPSGPDVGTLMRFVRLLRRERIEVIHGHNPLVHHYALIGGRLTGTPAIVNTIHGISNLADKPGFKERLYALACHFSGRIVAVCPMAYREFKRAGVIPVSKLTTINNGIPLDAFVKVPIRRPSTPFVFGIVGRLAPVKDHKTLLAAFERVVRERADCRLEILGDGALRAELEQLAQQLGIADKTLFHGFSTDVAGFLARIDTSVLSSVSEGLPLGVLESMAAGRPLIGTDVGGIRDLVEEGHCGWVCPPSNPEALAAAMLSSATADPDAHVRMAENARRHAIERYSLEMMAAEYEALFERLIAPKDDGRLSEAA